MTVIVVALAGLVGVGLVSTVAQPERMVAVLAAIGFPTLLAPLAAGAEAFALVALLLDPPTGAIALLFYILAATLGIASAQLRGIPLDDCGCLPRRQPVGPGFYLRNGMVAAACMGVLFGTHASRACLAMTLGLVVGLAVAGVVQWRIHVDNRRRRDRTEHTSSDPAADKPGRMGPRVSARILGRRAPDGGIRHDEPASSSRQTRSREANPLTGKRSYIPGSGGTS